MSESREDSNYFAQINLFTRGVETFSRGRDEMNLAEFPIAVVAEAAQPGQLTLRFSDTIKDQASGEMMVRSLTVHGTEEWGLPAAQDDEVMFGLLQLSYLAQWPRRIRFTRYQLCKLLRWSIGGASYRRIYQALHRLSTTNYNYRYAWRDKANQVWIPSNVFSYIQALKVHEADKPTDSGMCEVTWSDDFHSSLLAGNLKAIDFDLFVTLKRPTTKRLYRFLDKRFGLGQHALAFDLNTLAFDKIGINRNYSDAAQLKRSLMPAIRELVAAKYINPASPRERFQKVAKGQWKVFFKKYSPVSSSSAKTASEPGLLNRLLHHGVSKAVVRSLLAGKEAGFLKRQIELLEYNQSTGKGPANPGAWLATACQGDGFEPPAGFVSRAEQKARERDAAARSLEARSKQEQEEKVRERARQAAERVIAQFSDDPDSIPLLNQFRNQVSKTKARFSLGKHFDEEAHLRFLIADHLFTTGRIRISPKDLV